MHTIRYTSDTDYLCIVAGALHRAPYRIALRRLLAYLAIRWGNAWLDASADILDGHLPVHWETMAHHELIACLDLQGITPEHCILA